MIEELTDLGLINSFLKEFNQVESSLNNPFKKYVGYRQNNKIISFLCYSLIYDRIEIEYIYTDKQFRKNGLASILLNHLIELGLKNNCENITLEVRESNKTAINFYVKHGFKKLSIRKNYYKNEDGILMIRELI